MKDLANNIREFFQVLFGSRYIQRLELDVLQLRNDFDQRLHDKDVTIADLREQKAQLNAEVVMYRLRAGVPVVNAKPKVPSFATGPFDTPVKTRWQMEVEEHDKENARLDEEERQAKIKKQEAAS